MNRRRFLSMAAMAPAVGIAVKYGLASPTSKAWIGVDFAGPHIPLGDYMILSGFTNPEYNGKFKRVAENQYERI